MARGEVCMLGGGGRRGGGGSRHSASLGRGNDVASLVRLKLKSNTLKSQRSRARTRRRRGTPGNERGIREKEIEGGGRRGGERGGEEGTGGGGAGGPGWRVRRGRDRGTGHDGRPCPSARPAEPSGSHAIIAVPSGRRKDANPPASGWASATHVFPSGSGRLALDRPSATSWRGAAPPSRLRYAARGLGRESLRTLAATSWRYGTQRHIPGARPDEALPADAARGRRYPPLWPPDARAEVSPAAGRVLRPAGWPRRCPLAQ